MQYRVIFFMNIAVILHAISRVIHEYRRDIHEYRAISRDIAAIFSKKYNAEDRTNIAAILRNIAQYSGDIALMNIVRYC